VSMACWRFRCSLAWRAVSSFLVNFYHACVFTARRYASAVFAVVMCPPVRQSVRHKPVLYRNDWTNRAGFWHVCFLPSIPHCVVRKFGYLQSKVLPSGTLPQTPSGLRKFRHGKSTKLVDGRACRRRLYDDR